MAHSFSSGGLNEISSLESQESNHKMEDGDKKSGLSRIPRLNFSFRRNLHVTTPDPKLTTKSAPSPNESSPKVARSKSLRLPRNTTVKSRSGSELQRENEEYQTGVYQESKTVCHLRPRPRATSGSSSSPSSRSSSPGLVMRGVAHNQADASTNRFTEVQNGFDGSARTDSSSSSHRRAQSFSSRSRARAYSRGAAVSGRDNSGQRPPIGRSKTPAGTSRTASVTPSHRSDTEPRKLALNRTNSAGHTVKHSTLTTPQSQVQTQRPTMVRTESSGSVGSRKSSNGRRPSSVIVGGTVDLNKLAQEMSSSPSGESEDTTDGSFVSAMVGTRLASRIPTRGRMRPPYDRGSTPSPTEKTVANTGKSYGQPTLSSKAKLFSTKPRSSSFDKDKPQRPNSARGHYTIRPDVLDDDHRPMSAVGSNYEELDTKQKRKTSSPTSSGRSTPVKVEAKGVRMYAKDSKQIKPPNSVPRTSGLPLRGIRTRGLSSSGMEQVGINELEGTVLLEADDYRRICNEVKSLKTMLLKLKRGLMVDNLSSQGYKSRKNSPPGSSGTSLSELTKKIEELTKERDKAQEEVSRVKKENKAKAVRVEQLASELQQARKKGTDLGDKLREMEAHRDYLLDKVERIHADKHKLEDKLNGLEKARFYERTLSESTWIEEDLDMFEELEGEGGKGERKETESDLGDSLMLSDEGEGESSEPESAAVCSVPLS